MDYVTDTHALVWYFSGDERLSSRALQAFEDTIQEGIIYVPAVVLAEIIYIARKGRITLTFQETLKKIEELENFCIVPLDKELLNITDKIGAELEMHDKLIVATSHLYSATLITKDEKIRKSKIVKVIW